MDGSLLYLVQTDTTAGFVSQSKERLNLAKERDSRKPLLLACDSYATLKQFTRAPLPHRAKIRRAKKSSFIYPNGIGARVVSSDSAHYRFLKKFGYCFTTSANQSAHAFKECFALAQADVIVKDKRGIFESKPSNIYRLSRTRVKKIRS